MSRRAGVGPRRNTQEIEPQVGVPGSTQARFFSPKHELQSGEVDRGEVAEHENTARKGDGEFDICTQNPKSDEMSSEVIH